MSYTRRTILFLLALSIIFIVAGCAPSQPSAAEPSPLVPTRQLTSTPTRTPEPTSTPLLPTATITSSPTTAPSETPTRTPAPQTDFSEATLYTAGFLPKWRYFFAVKVPFETIKGEYYAIVDRNKEYACEVLAAYPNRLYCTGPLSAANDFIDYVIYEQDTNLKVFEGNIFVPLQ